MMSTYVKCLTQCLAYTETKRGAGNWKPHEIFAASLFCPQGISAFLGYY